MNEFGQVGLHKKRTRRSRLTQNLIDDFAEALELGVPQETVIRRSGVPRSTFYDWLRRGRDELDAGVKQKDQSIYADLAVVINRAAATGITNLVKLVRDAAATDWKAAMTMLERIDPEHFGRRQRVDVVMDLPIVARNVELIRNQLVRYVEVADQYGDDLATQLFQIAGITVQEAPEA